MTDGVFRLVQISDPHLGLGQPDHQDNWEQVLEWLAAERPDLVVVTGDVVFNDPDSDADYDHARRQMSRIPVAWRIIAGNHDLGDSMINASAAARITPARRARWRAAFGPEWWVEPCAGWALIGLNAQLLNAPGADTEQLAFLAQTIAGLPADTPIALFTHKALFADFPSEQTVSTNVLDPLARADLLRLFQGRRLRLVASGHNHQYRSFGLAGTLHVWAPSVASLIKTPDAQHWGQRQVGFIDYRLQPGGRVRLRCVGQDFLIRNENYIQASEDRARREPGAA